ncbi:serine carboxypeptidase [Apiospora kogelbergensis]|uniref:serine carboxypeptidase n=1 Tax=Apiospora kogelbergensis TaxID=1337665 RepID=UPI00312EE232
MSNPSRFINKFANLSSIVSPSILIIWLSTHFNKMMLRALAAAFCAPGVLGAISVQGEQQQQAPLLAAADDWVNAKVVTHEAHPHHSLSFTAHSAGDVKATRTAGGDKTPNILDVCPGATDGYTGYLNSGSKHFYFAYFESRSSPKDDPLVMWINGGPGCSSMTGLLMELGPCAIDDGGESAHENKDSWINAANVFFLDQPIGVGFSYSDNSSDHARGTFAASEDIYAFMQLWYKAFPDSRSLPFSIAGESYGGHYIPIFASHINDMNKISPPETQIPLESVLIGNGIFADTVQATSSYDITCTNVTGIGPILEDDVCKRMAAAVPRCEYLMKACEDYPDPIVCSGAYDYCGSELQNPYFHSGRNYYDVSKPCVGPLCYPIMKSITTFCDVMAFGVNPDTPKFEACSDKVGDEFRKANDGLIDTRPFVADLLHSEIRVLIYVGTYDWICNFVGNERVFGSLPWKGLADFRYQQENNKQVWEGGLWWESGVLRYVRINGAGHMVPFDKPKHAINMFSAWLNKKPLV